MIGIASKTLRNSDYVPPEVKEKLFDSITNAWFNTIRVICLMAPALAKDSEAGYDGFNLFLASSFDKYNDDLNTKLIQIIINIPLISDGSSILASPVTLSMPTYSALWIPAEISTVGPGRSPQSSTWGT